MTKDDIMRMAQEAGFERLGHNIDDWVCFSEEIEAFAKSIRNHYSYTHAQLWLKRFDDAVRAEREACAKVCEDISSKYKWPDDTAEKVASQWCADRIRARGQA
jgi:hypothetical protein